MNSTFTTHLPLSEIHLCRQWSVGQVLEWGCDQMLVCDTQAIPSFSMMMVRLEYEGKKDGHRGVRGAFSSSSAAQCACWYLLPRQEGLNHLSPQWVDVYLCVWTDLCLCEYSNFKSCSVVINKSQKSLSPLWGCWFKGSFQQLPYSLLFWDNEISATLMLIWHKWHMNVQLPSIVQKHGESEKQLGWLCPKVRNPTISHLFSLYKSKL